MSSDRARVSFNRKRLYRSVVAQQGRVTLEADINEAQQIAAEDLRRETIDIVGPAGTPKKDNGYEVKAGGPMPGFTVAKGTTYVGGLKLELPADVSSAAQPDWLNRAVDPLSAAQTVSATELIYLLVREQEVSAVEDSALREMALGGPDSAQRTRMLQRFLRLGVANQDCAPALTTAANYWASQGVNFAPADMTLTSPAKLLVTFTQNPVAATPCDPQVQGGYIGADNQLIRVQITSFNPGNNTGKLVWSYDNASFLHRVHALTTTVLQLEAEPLDAYHTPQGNQALELLLPAVDLANGDFIAAYSGVIVKSQAGYVAGSRQLVLTSALSAAYSNPNQPMFLRLWKDELTFTAGQALTLPQTGLRVTINMNGPSGLFTPGQFWTFAVRPSTPAAIYPHRYLDAPQPPEGPRMWACPLATIGWAGQQFNLLSDCRLKFPPLTDIDASDVGFDNKVCAFPPTVKTVQEAIDALCQRKQDGGICSIVAGPGDDLQKLVDTIPPGADAHICLKIGTFNLSATVKIESKGHVLLHGSGPGTSLVIAGGECAVLVSGCSSFTVRDCTFHGGAAGDGNSGLKGLSGALTIRDCQDAEVFSAAFTCTTAMRRATSGLAIYSTKASAMRAVVENCIVGVGHRQVGILIVNAGTARVVNNQIQTAGQLPAGASRLRRRILAKMMVSRLEVANAPPAKKAIEKGGQAASAGKEITVTVAGIPLRFRADPGSGLSADDWQRFVTTAKPPKQLPPHVARRWLLKATEAAIAKAESEASPRSRVRRALKLLFQEPVAASQGIVVAGEHTGDVAITGNVVRQAQQGIHVGTSTAAMHTPLFTDRVYVSDNAVTVSMSTNTAARHGIFVGNCHSLHVLDNRIDATGASLQNDPAPPEGIRMFGALGLFAVIRANHISGLQLGIRFNPLIALPLPEKPQWIVTDNLAESAQQVVVTPSSAIRNRIRGVLDNYA